MQEIILQKTDENDVTVVYELKAGDIQHDLIGISATLLLPDEVTFKDFVPGEYFEEETSEATYLIAPKSSDPTKLLVGIASLGESKSQGSGTIVTLHFTKTSPETSSSIQIYESSASGSVEGQRVDYNDILWHTEVVLPTTGPLEIYGIFFISFCAAIFLFLFYKKLFHNNLPKKTRGNIITRLSL
ncbi:MAG: hypothetical protein A2V81_00180 [Candidatus Abawacabacteria bacterium RBG_16_42_10]|uniref:Cohesin domain-containing protein n=1 Tax=Candidatus Abawacabacteria bacterium RBG_16_42_10 TaxID=1817814 RepID=A0A1F4XLB1_9BACT|nr:MAG: hypothetical protein A2V81_00180 [Candidatus Abawacabacteria bacterium RBG_16_42_10]